jgi:alkaline phosphatase
VVRLAEKEGVHPSQISRDLAARSASIKKHEADAAQKEIQERERSMGTYEEVILEAFQEWERSKEDKGRQKQQQTTGSAGASTAGSSAAKVVSEVVSEGRLGDPQYLRTVIEARKRLDKLAGIDVDVLLLQCAELAEKVKERMRGMGHAI